MSVFTYGSVELESSDETEDEFSIVTVLLAPSSRTILSSDSNKSVSAGDNLGTIYLDATAADCRVTFLPTLAQAGKKFEVTFIRKDTTANNGSVSIDGTSGGDIVQLSQQGVAYSIEATGAALRVISSWITPQ